MILFLKTTYNKNDLGIMFTTFGETLDSFSNHHLSKEPCQEKKSMTVRNICNKLQSSQDRQAKKSKLQFE